MLNNPSYNYTVEHFKSNVCQSSLDMVRNALYSLMQTLRAVLKEGSEEFFHMYHPAAGGAADGAGPSGSGGNVGIGNERDVMNGLLSNMYGLFWCHMERANDDGMLGDTRPYFQLGIYGERIKEVYRRLYVIM